MEAGQGKRDFFRLTRGTMIASAPAEGAIVGYGVTADLGRCRTHGEKWLGLFEQFPCRR